MAGLKVHQLSNGLTLIGEEMSGVASAAVNILVPVGAATDPVGIEGSASVLAELLQKGAGDWSNEQLSEQFEELGAHRSVSAGIEVTSFSSALLGENIGKVIELYGAMITAPHLPEAELENVRQLSLQELNSLEDEPSSKVMVELAAKFYPDPFGRCQLGTEAGLRSVTADSIRKYYQQYYLPGNAIIGVAGKFDWNAVVRSVEQAFGSWRGSRPALDRGEFSKESSAHHIERDTNQVQIALGYPSVSYEDKHYYTAKVAIGVLSGGMSGRLFIEVREKRGLVYRVSASHSAAKGRAAVFAAAGTTPENAEECLRIIAQELAKVREGVSEEELQRSKADLKSRMIMQGEMSYVRSSAIVNDWWHIGRVRTLEEMKRAIDLVTDQDIREYSEACPPYPATLVSLGPKFLELPQEFLRQRQANK